MTTNQMLKKCGRFLLFAPQKVKFEKQAIF